VAITKIKTVFFDLGDTLVISATRQWCPGAPAILMQLAAQGIVLGVISNTGNLRRDQLEPLLPVEFSFSQFKESLILLSGELGVEKPSPRIFALAVSATGRPAAESLYCSEDLLETTVAQSIDMRAIRVNAQPGDDLTKIVAILTEAGLI